ncbi:MAG TPA: ATP-binding cassette domain-containing protein, partial [Myxococcota bacterium]|nr:ATP-binding cassette domain-containing protein [Myxococcota bacterium]
MIEISRVEKRFGQTQVLRGVDLTIARAEVVALLGPSGCGKTTLLRILAGLETPDAGSVSVDGVLLASATSTTPPEKRNIGLVFQDFALFPHLRVDANVAFGLAHLPAPDRASIVSQTLARFDLSDL